MLTVEKQSISSLDHTYQTGRGIKLHIFYCYGSYEESVLVLSVIRACLDGVRVVNLELTTREKSVKVA